MTVSLFPSLVCLPLFEENSGLFSVGIEHNRITQDVCQQYPITGAVSFLIAETRVRKKACASSLLHEDGEIAEFKVSKTLV